MDVDRPKFPFHCGYHILHGRNVCHISKKKGRLSPLLPDRFDRLFTRWNNVIHSYRRTVAAKVSAMASPIPEPAPVTKATRLLRSTCMIQRYSFLGVTVSSTWVGMLESAGSESCNCIFYSKVCFSR